MQNLYNNALQTLRKPIQNTYQLFQTNWNYREFKTTEAKSIQVKTKANEVKKPEITKKEVLESFAGFAKDQLEVKPKLSFKGGELAPKSQNYEFSINTSSSIDELYDLAKPFFSDDMLTVHFADKVPGKVKVLFVSDIYLDQSITVLSNPNQYHCCFDATVSALFEKMVKAMGLESSQILISALNDETDANDLTELLLAEISFFKPQFIVSLGAQSTAYFIGSENKLRNCHGQLFQLNFKNQDDIISKAALMPLFSPKLLNIAPNMKKTAWEDMQKLMQKF